MRGISGLTLSLFAMGCTVPVVTGLDDREATEVAVALERGGVAGLKEDDPNAEGRFRITVGRDDAAEALSVLRDEALPHARPKGVLEAMGQGALVPSQTSEHAAHVVGLAGDLEHSLLSIEGVLHARVHLNLPAPDPLRGTVGQKATASVLVEHRGLTPPLTQESIQRLIAGGLPNLQAADVAVVLVPRAARAMPSGERLSHLGPFAVSHGSKRVLQFSLAGLVTMILGLSITALLLYSRLMRMREKAD